MKCSVAGNWVGVVISMVSWSNPIEVEGGDISLRLGAGSARGTISGFKGLVTRYSSTGRGSLSDVFSSQLKGPSGV